MLRRVCQSVHSATWDRRVFETFHVLAVFGLERGIWSPAAAAPDDDSE